MGFVSSGYDIAEDDLKAASHFVVGVIRHRELKLLAGTSSEAEAEGSGDGDGDEGQIGLVDTEDEEEEEEDAHREAADAVVEQHVEGESVQLPLFDADIQSRFWCDWLPSHMDHEAKAEFDNCYAFLMGACDEL